MSDVTYQGEGSVIPGEEFDLEDYPTLYPEPQDLDGVSIRSANSVEAAERKHIIHLRWIRLLNRIYSYRKLQRYFGHIGQFLQALNLGETGKRLKNIYRKQ